MKQLIATWFQPVALLVAFTLFQLRGAAIATEVSLGLVVLVFVLERVFPYRKDWNPPLHELAIDLFLWAVLIGTLWAGVIGDCFAKILDAVSLKIQPLGFLWPHSAPYGVKLLLAFLIAELMMYWVHRLQHASSVFWTISGHGVHHSPVGLNALKGFITHPLEMFWLIVPAMLLLKTLFGVEDDVMEGVGAMETIGLVFAHCNLPANSRIDWILTTSANHRLHHSVTLSQSNTNYGCSVMIWDRLFGTYLAAEPVDKLGVGSGARLTLAQQLLMPLRPNRVTPVTTLAPTTAPSR